MPRLERQPNQLRAPHYSELDWIAKRVATTSTDAIIKVWDSETGQELLTLADHSFRNNGIAFSPDDNRLVCGGPTTPRLR